MNGIKRWLLVVLAMVLTLTPLFGVGGGVAKGAAVSDVRYPTGGVLGRTVEDDETYQARYDVWHVSTISGPTSGKTGTTMTWTIGNFRSSPFKYQMSVGILDGSFANSKTADIQTVSNIFSKSSFTYTFYFPGTYVIFLDIWYGESYNYGTVDTLQVKITSNGENTVTRKITQVVNSCKVAGDEFQTALKLHDWLLNNCTYDYSYKNYSAEAVFLYGTGVCNTYARAYVHLCEKAGLQVRRVLGKGGGENHAWNAVRINGKWYMLDATWDDYKDLSDDYQRHAYFGITSKMISINHTIERYNNSTGPASAVTCNSIDENYFVHTKKWKDYSSSLLSSYQSQMSAGYHRFSMDAPVPVDEYYYSYTFGKIVAKGMSNETWTYNGKNYTGTFTYDASTGLVTGKHTPAGTLTLPSALVTLEANAFTGDKANVVVIPDQCTSIGSKAFSDMELWEVYIPASVTSIASDAFANNRGKILIIAPEGSKGAQFAKSGNYLYASGD